MDDGRKLRLVMAASLVCIGVAGRLAFRGLMPPGNELVAFDLWISIGAVSVLAGSLLGRNYGIAVPLLAMAFSDMYIDTVLIGGGAVFILEIAVFTWTGFALVRVGRDPLQSYWQERGLLAPRSDDADGGRDRRGPRVRRVDQLRRLARTVLRAQRRRTRPLLHDGTAVHDRTPDLDGDDTSGIGASVPVSGEDAERHAYRNAREVVRLNRPS